jgi:EAL domain-containing protein (putative c-di-GMP-specific phosphodiesterase class I)
VQRVLINHEERARWRLKAVSHPEEKWMINISPLPFIIGRGDDCSLKLSDKWISRHHAEIRAGGDHLWVRDLESRNGTFVNNKMVEHAELLEDGDLLSLGKFKFQVKLTQPPAFDGEETCSMEREVDVYYTAALGPILQQLIQNRTVFPDFQPILGLSDKKVIGYEILGRVPENVLPSNTADLMDIAEWMGYASELSSLFREVGVEVGRNLPGTPFLFVNTCPSEIYRIEPLLESLKTIHALAPKNRIVLEINEKAATGARDMARLRTTLRHLDMGLAFDDFGAGQTRLVELAKVPPDFLKFDISLIRHIHLAPKRLQQMVTTFVKAAQDLGIATLAEGIECSDEARTCEELGFDYVQGFFYGKPLPFSDIHPA